MAETRGQGQGPRLVAFPNSTKAAPLLDFISSSHERMLLGRIRVCIRNLSERSNYSQFMFDKRQRKGRMIKSPVKSSGAGVWTPPVALMQRDGLAQWACWEARVLFLCPIFYHITHQTPLSGITNLPENG